MLFQSCFKKISPFVVRGCAQGCSSGSGWLIRKDAVGNPRREGGDNRDINEGGSAADRSTVGAGRGRGTGIQ